MAKTSSERIRNFRERKKAELTQLQDSTYVFLAEPFHIWLERTSGQGDWDSALYHLDAAGLDPVEIADDAGPRSKSGEVEMMHTDDYDPFAGYAGSIGHAECVIDNLLAAAHNMAIVVSRFKQENIRARLKQIEAADLNEPSVRKQALLETVRLTKILDELERQIRMTFQQWKVKEI